MKKKMIKLDLCEIMAICSTTISFGTLTMEVTAQILGNKITINDREITAQMLWNKITINDRGELILHLK